MAAKNQIVIYTDGSCLGNPGPGGWGAIIIAGAQDPQRLSGQHPWTTNNRMEVMAAIQGLEATPQNATISLYSDSQYLVHTMTRNWKRRKNNDLWDRLDSLVSEREVDWNWIYGHTGDRWNEEADRLAVSAMKVAADAKRQPKERHGR